MNWIYKGIEVLSTEHMKDLTGNNNDPCGIVYKIWLSDGYSYIGKKTLQFKKRKKPTKKSGLKRCKISYVESNWKQYEGSSYQLQNALQSGKVKIEKKQILHICFSKADTNYLEVKEQWLQGVLEDPKSFCSNISGKYFSRVEKEWKK